MKWHRTSPMASDATTVIKATVTVKDKTYQCTFTGVESGIGDPCTSSQ